MESELLLKSTEFVVVETVGTSEVVSKGLWDTCTEFGGGVGPRLAVDGVLSATSDAGLPVVLDGGMESELLLKSTEFVVVEAVGTFEVVSKGLWDTCTEFGLPEALPAELKGLA
jgi:hypothetical protein